MKAEQNQMVRRRIQLRGLLRRCFSGRTMGYRQVIAILLPLLVDQAFVFGSNLINTAMISSTGMAAVSAVNMVDSINIFLVSAFVAVATGGTVVVAQYKGRGDEPMVSRAAAAGVSTVFLFSLAVSAAFLAFRTPLLSLLFGQAEADVMQNARIYFFGSCLSYCGVAVEESVCGALRGIGEARSALSLSLIMNLSYLGLNVVFINALGMGVAGMAVSINLSRYLGAFCALFYLIRVNMTLHFNWRDMLRAPLSLIKRILFVGVPFAAEQMFFNGGKIITQILIVELGTGALAVNAICNAVLGVAQVPAQALTLTLITVVGQCVGRRDIEDARRYIVRFLWVASGSFVLTALLTIPITAGMSPLFHPPASLQATIVVILAVNALAQIPFWPASFALPSALRAAGDARFTSIVSMLSMWLFRLGVGILLGMVLRMGIMGFWFAMDAEWSVRGLIFWRRFKGRKWHSHHVID